MATIDDKVTFEEFRKRCEDKSTITTKGQLYVGTSDHDTVNGKQITRTVATPEPTEYALLVRDDTQAGGLNWKPVVDVLLAAKNAGQSTSVESADYAKTAGVASNVESQINGHNITDIFESDGTIVKNATDALNAVNAANTDFTNNSEWINVLYDDTLLPTDYESHYINKTDMVSNATYQIVGSVGLGTTADPKVYISGFIYAAEAFMNTDKETHSVCCLAPVDEATTYTIFFSPQLSVFGNKIFVIVYITSKTFGDDGVMTKEVRGRASIYDLKLRRIR